MAEILAGTRLIHCHSYRQDEVQMLANLCAEFGIRIGTYQHNLEGYKVAEFVKQQAIGASLFSDWWGFKVEVQDGIPYAGPIMHEQGVVVSYNSDRDELARRMHVEAAKAHKYSRQKDGTYSVSEEEALKFVTLNPAKQLGIESRVGSLETGKDADVVIWSGSPLSSTSRCEATFVDGRLLFSLEKDRELREQNARERARIIQRLLAGDKKPKDAKAGEKDAKDEKAGDAGTPAGESGKKEMVDTPADKPPRAGDRRGLIAAMVDDSARLRRELFLDMMRRGINPADHRAGVCGCDEHMGR
jgi:N-acetylglucosamine-6-phosphate deacetylase